MKIPISSRLQLGRKRVRIDMLPLIDIVFLLLVFFIYAMLSMAVHRSLPVVLPVSETAEIDPELNLTVTVKENGQLFLDALEIAPEQMQVLLQKRAAMASADGKSVSVSLFADRKLSYQELYKILDMIRAAGIANVSLQSDSTRETPAHAYCCSGCNRVACAFPWPQV